jgi:conjugation system TraG family ATPase
MIDELMPIYKVEQDCILSKQGDITLAFEVTLPEIFTLSTEDFETLHQAWLKAIRLLPMHTVLHKQDWFMENHYRQDYTKEDQTFLSASSEKFFNERPYLDHRCYLYLTQKPAGRRASTALFSTLTRSSITPVLQHDLVLQGKFMDKAGQFVRILEDSGYVQLRRLKEDELASTPEASGLIEQYCTLMNPGEKPVIRDIQVYPELKVGNLHCQLFSLADVEDLPAQCAPRITYDKYSSDKTKFSVAFAAPLGQILDCNHLYNQYIIIDDSRETLKKLEAKRLRLQSLSAHSRENTISREATDNFLNEAISQQRLPVKAHYNILTWCEDKDRAPEIRNTVSAAIAKMDARTYQETACAPQIFWAGIPGNAADLPEHETFDTFAEQATCFLNMETNYQSSISPVGIRLADRISGIPVLVDLSDEPKAKGIIQNFNKFILGPSGSGKSFFTNLFLRSYVEQGAHAVVVDVGHSYHGLCKLLDGYYFTYTPQNPITFNPFFLGEDELDTEKKESIKTLLLALWKRDDETFTRSEYVSLSNALTAYFAHLNQHPSIFPCFNSFYEYLRDIFLLNLKKEIKEKDFDVDNFLYVLRPYYSGGEYDYLLNAKENLELLSQHFIVFELDNIQDHPILYTTTIIIVIEIFLNKMRKLKGVKKIILIEEAWKAIMRKGMAESIQYWVKTLRKFYGELVVVTQEVDDIISSPIVKEAIINNSDCKILLDQRKYQNRFDQIQELLGLSEKEKAQILSQILSINRANDPNKKYKEVFISLGGVLSKVYRTEVSPEEYLTYTTEEKEKVHVQAYAQKYGSLKRGIAQLARDQQNKTQTA